MADVRFAIEGVLGRVTLSRPHALNALTLPMIREIDDVLRRWEGDTRVKAVWLEGEGGRAFCAGGDIVSVHEALTATPPNHAATQELWRHQHELDVLLSDYRKPVVSALDGIVLGGGVGLGCHVPYRMATERTRIGMPETSLGLAPDVGALHILWRSPARIGDHIALTGQMFGPLVAVSAGFADAIVHSDALDDIADDLSRGAAPEEVISAASVRGSAIPPGPGIELSESDVAELCWCYDSADISTILGRLDDVTSPWARRAAERILRASPLAICTVLHVLRSPAVEDLGAMFIQDLRRNVNFSYRPDLVEGVRATVIDKTVPSRWTPRDFDEVTSEDIDACLAPFDGPDLDVEGVLSRP